MSDKVSQFPPRTGESERWRRVTELLARGYRRELIRLQQEDQDKK